MSKLFVLQRSEHSGFRPPCLDSLLTYGGSIFSAQHDLPEPIGIFNHAWSQVCKCFNLTIDDLDSIRKFNERKAERTERLKLVESLIRNYQDLIFRAAEYVENLTDNIASTLSPNPKKKVVIKGSESARKALCIPVNKLKHNHNRLVYVEGFHHDSCVPGISFYHYSKGALRPNLLIHKSTTAFSFNCELRRIAVLLYQFSIKCAIEISELSTAYRTAEKNSDVETERLIDRIISLPIYGLADERSTDMPYMARNGEAYHFSISDGEIISQPKGSRIQVAFTGDGASTSFVLPTEPS